MASICQPLLQPTVSGIKRNLEKPSHSTSLPSIRLCLRSALYPPMTLLSKSMQRSKDSSLDLGEVLAYSGVTRGTFILRGTFWLRREGKNYYSDGEHLSLLRPKKMLSSDERKSWSGNTQATASEFEKISYFDTYRSINWKKLKLNLTLGRDIEQHIYYSSYQLHPWGRINVNCACLYVIRQVITQE